MSTIRIKAMGCHEGQVFLNLFHAIFPEVSAGDEELIETLWCDTNAEQSMTLLAKDGETAVGLTHGAVHDGTLYIVALGVAPDYRRRGIASRLLDYMVEAVKDLKVTSMRVSDYPYGYILPGVVQPSGIAFFTAHGFVTESRPVAMSRDLGGFHPDSKVFLKEQELRTSGYTFDRYGPDDLLQTIDFFDRCMPADWKDIVKVGYSRGNSRQNGICCRDPEGKMVGAAFYHMVGRDPCRFGPIGVDPETRGLSIGAILLHECLRMQSDEHLERSYFLWCHEDSPAYRMYRKAGFEIRFEMQVMSREL